MCKYIDILKREIKQIQLYLSANIIKNALGIGIPGTGKIGIEIAATLGGAGIAEATGACCGMTYLQGGTLENIKRAINNMLADLSGLICDRAKTSCVLKIATATIQCSTSSNTIPSSKDGIVFDDVEETIKSIAKLVKEGLANTDNKEAKDT
ncbi:L-serine ammonia-lyase, iron-sulfur-dependent, subunit alpha [Clostridioides sp. ZZV15-6388]|uniref:L-serine ammonia-lyase, iron-sulfur-dependent, subunit alpha n=1 Tax=unclassified Clostridioides TaxID=2635829 RepID=UPI001D12B1D9|nr:L-serine ammonia-lyase, iron-sulfur-dependent, subunit alpha [Clostridioides sp. ZZV15-6388]MCC0664342.1 L-serine ammonia-lyase, iron-sulfur-dependent, subunit alpha [Clostridioides sp. ZZV15-6597]